MQSGERGRGKEEAGLVGMEGVGGGQGNDGHVTHESPAHNSQLVTLKLRPPPTLPWQEFERGYGQEEGG